MALVKLVKNKAYFKRFQVKYRRRREGKTDYKARKGLIWQAKNKYATPKYRMVVRITNKDVVTQIVTAHISGDRVFCHAYSHELPRYGLSVGLTNYSAAYATGLLLARRTLKKIGLDNKYVGAVEIDGKKLEQEVDAERGPFTAYLDIGLRRNVKGGRIYGALKGAVDGGLHIPHNEKCFPGYDSKEKKYEAEEHVKKINGETVSQYMSELAENDESTYRKMFSKYVAAGITPEKYVEVVQNSHNKIREDPSPKPKGKAYSGDTRKLDVKRNLKQRKNRVKQIKDQTLTALRAVNTE